MMFRKLTVLRQYLQVLLRYQGGSIALSVFITTFSGLTKGGSFVILIPLIQMAGGSADAGVSSRAFNIANSVWEMVGVQPTLYVCLVIYILLVSVYAGLGYVKTRLDTRIVQTFKQNLRNDLFSSVVDAEWGYLKNTHSTHIFNNLITEIDSVGYITTTLMTAFSTVVILLFYTATSLYISVTMTVFAGATFLPLIFAQRYLNTRMYAIGEAAYARHETLFKAVLEFVNSLKLAKSHNVQDRYKAEFEIITQKTAADANEFTRLTAQTDIIYEIGSAISISLVLILAITFIKIPVVDLLLMVYIASKLLPNFSSLIRNFQYLLNSLPAYEGVAALLAEARQNKEQITHQLSSGSFPKKTITFSEVDFSYEPGVLVFSQFSAEIKVGKRTAIVGVSGKGKTTLMDLLLGLLKPQKGFIRLDGVDLNTLDLAAWRSATAYIPQECFLFNTTIRKNLLWSKPDATDDELRDVLKLVAGEFVLQLTNGLDTVVGDQGTRLSGGERQRIALARALLRRPQLLILDEATNALDVANELIIQKAIDQLSDNVTVIVISHDKQFHEGYDEIVDVNS